MTGCWGTARPATAWRMQSARCAAHARTPVIMLIRDLHIRIANAATGELLRELTLDPSRNYQPTGQPPDPRLEHPENAETPNPNKGSGRPRCRETGQGGAEGI